MARDKAYRIAERKIEVAQRSGAKKLDLSVPYEAKDPKLTELPESLGQLTQLQELNLRNNQLRALPESLGQLTHLQTLNLTNNKLTALPVSLGQLMQLQSLDLSNNQLTALPESLGQLTQLQALHLNNNQLTAVPEFISNLTKLQILELGYNELTKLPEFIGELKLLHTIGIENKKLKEIPESLGNLRLLKELSFGGSSSAKGVCLKELPSLMQKLKHLQTLWAWNCDLRLLPSWLGELEKLKRIELNDNKLTDLPPNLAQLEHLEELELDDNPLNPELAAAHEQGLDAVKAYLRAKAAAQITLNEAKLILVGEGEVGKSCLLGALRGDPFVEGLPTTHGIEIKPVKVTDPDSKTEITLNGWDFGGQRVYRPTHQLFFSSPAVYLVVWKPREGPQQGFVKEWIKLVKHRETDAKILVVATHGGPQQRQPDIDRQELWDLFGKDLVLDFFHVESKPDKKGNRRGIEKLKRAIAQVASTLPEMGRKVPKSFQEVRKALKKTGEAYLSLESVFDICHEHQMDDELARLFVIISHRLGYLIHYEHDPALRDIVVLKPDWLAAAISFVLDDEATRKENNGIVSFARLSQLWNDPTREAEFRYTPDLHPLFLRLMERFDLSYKVSLSTEAPDAIGFWQQVKGSLNKAVKGKDDLANLHYTSLIGQLVPDNRPEEDLEREWPPEAASVDIQQGQICHIVDEKGQSATSEGLFYQLIVRLHKYSLGRVHFKESVHWQRGLVLDDDYNGRALLEHIGNDVRITVRAAYPERFLAMLTSEVKYLVESFWEGLRCDVMVPCVTPCGKDAPGIGLFEVEKLIAFKRQGLTLFPCMVSGCNQAQIIDSLLRNAPAIRPVAAEELFAGCAEVKQELATVRQLLIQHDDKAVGRFDRLDISTQRILSRIDDAFDNFVKLYTDEAKEGPRLFSFVPVDRSNFNPKKWVRVKFRLTLWCERSRLPLPNLNGKDRKKGVYEIELTREWFKKASPYLKLLTGTLSLVLPVASSGFKFALDDKAYKEIEEQLDFGKNVITATIGEGAKIGEFMGASDATTLEHGEAVRAQGATLRELHALLKAKDPGFGGLVRVMNKRQEFLWVHAQFEKEY